MRPMPMRPKIVPSASPEGSSRIATFHQSRTVTSRSASERMISDVACDPELPPELMMSGMKRLNTIAFSSDVS